MLFYRKALLEEMEAGKKQLTFHLTGFGKFQGVDRNPTTELMGELPAYLAENPIYSSEEEEKHRKVRLAHFNVLETSG